MALAPLHRADARRGRKTQEHKNTQKKLKKDSKKT